MPLGIWLGSTENAPRCCRTFSSGDCDRRIDSLRVDFGPQSTRRRFGGSRGPKMPAPKLRNLRSYLPKSRRLRAPDNEGSVQMQECRQGGKRLQALVSWLEPVRRSCRKPSRRDGRDPHGCEARSTRVTSQISGHAIHPQSLEKRQAVEESFRFADGPLSASSRRRKSFTVSTWSSALTAPLEILLGDQGHDAQDLSKHGIFEAWFYELDFQFDSANTAVTYNSQDIPGHTGRPRPVRKRGNLLPNLHDRHVQSR